MNYSGWVPRDHVPKVLAALGKDFPEAQSHAEHVIFLYSITETRRAILGKMWWGIHILRVTEG